MSAGRLAPFASFRGTRRRAVPQPLKIEVIAGVEEMAAACQRMRTTQPPTSSKHPTASAGLSMAAAGIDQPRQQAVPV